MGDQILEANGKDLREATQEAAAAVLKVCNCVFLMSVKNEIFAICLKIFYPLKIKLSCMNIIVLIINPLISIMSCNSQFYQKIIVKLLTVIFFY